MDKDFIIWLLTVICISWLIMLTIYAFELKRSIEYLRTNDHKNYNFICDIRSDIGTLYRRVHDLKEGEENEHEL
jgi:hypothetical protein